MKRQMVYTSGRVLALSLVLLGAFGGAVQAIRHYDTLDAAVLRPGMLVSATVNTNVIAPATPHTAATLAGVVVAEQADDTQQPLSQAPTNEQMVPVAPDGQVQTLVSTVNGDIRSGDRITVSPLEGIGAKATGNGWIVGIAQADFSADATDAITADITDSSNATRQVSIGRIPVVVNVTYYAGAAKQGERSAVMAFADSVSGKRATVLALVLSFVVLFVGLVVVGLIVNSTIRGGFSAMSRQPLIRRFIVGSIAQSLLLALFVLLAVFAAAYLILRFV